MLLSKNLKNPFKVLRNHNFVILHIIKDPNFSFLHQVCWYWMHTQSKLVFIKCLQDKVEYWKHLGNGRAWAQSFTIFHAQYHLSVLFPSPTRICSCTAPVVKPISRNSPFKVHISFFCRVTPALLFFFVFGGISPSQIPG